MTGAIVGGVVGGLAALGALAALLFFCRRYRRQCSGPQPLDINHERPGSLMVKYMGGSKSTVPGHSLSTRRCLPSGNSHSTEISSQAGTTCRDSQYTASTLPADDFNSAYQYTKWPMPDTLPAPISAALELQHLGQKELEHQVWVINKEIEQLRSKVEELSYPPPSISSGPSLHKTGVESVSRMDMAQVEEQIRTMSEQIAF